jgi:hypothetical protein
MSKESFVDESKEIKRRDWTLVYNPEFEEYRDKYKNIISKVKSVIEGREVDGVEVEKLNIGREFNREYFILKIDNEEFFVKKISNEKEGGVDEFNAGKIVEERIHKAGLKKVKSIKYIFAYTDNTVRYAVSKYNKDAENTLYDYIGKLRVKGDYTKSEELSKRVVDIPICLYDYMDLRSGNMGYDPETDEITLFDLNLKSTSLIESGDDEL